VVLAEMKAVAERVDFTEAATIVEGIVGKISQPTSHTAGAGSGNRPISTEPCPPHRTAHMAIAKIS
jgi:hypothetical protein